MTPNPPAERTPVKVMQSIPDGKGANCMEACVATLFGCSIDDVPTLRDGNWTKKLREWCAPKGFGFVSIAVPNEDVFKSEFGFGYQIAAGQSRRGRLHAVVLKDGELWHDPHPDSTGLVSIEQADYFYPLNLADARSLETALGQARDNIIALQQQLVGEIRARVEAEADEVHLRSQLEAARACIREFMSEDCPMPIGIELTIVGCVTNKECGCCWEKHAPAIEAAQSAGKE